MLCLTKTTGIALAVIGIGIVIIRNILDRKNKLPNSKKETKAIIIAILLTMLFTSFWYIKISSVDTKWNYTEFVQVDGQKEGLRGQITKSFWQSIFTNETITDKGLTVFGVFLVLVALFICTKKSVKNENYNYYGKSFIIATILYLIGTWIIYITIFDVGEAVTLTSFDRYTSVILLALTMFLINVLIEEEKTNEGKIILVAIAIILVLLPVTNISEKYVDAKAHMDMANINRDIYTKLRYKTDSLDTNNELLYLTRAQDEPEFLQALNNYEIMPIKIKEARIGSFRSLEDFEKLVKNYTHIYIYRLEDDEKEKIKEIFENNYVGDDMLYRVVYEGEQVKLEIER